MTGKTNIFGRLLKRTSMLCGAALLPVAPALANPLDGVVVGGNATITHAGKITTINQASNKTIIDWRSFDIAADETTQFVQPSSQAIALNRIKDNKPSQIDGQLKANGNIILINPNGVVFGAGSRVDVNSLVVSSSDVDNDEFMNNAQARFNKAGNADASIINHGTITVAQAGLAGFVAPNIGNHGTITATLGKVKLASGDSFTLDLAGDGLTQIAASDALTHQLIENAGTIEANGGVIQITAAEARNSIASLVNNKGVMKADSFQQKGGKIILTAGGTTGKIKNTGTIQAKATSVGEKAGEITLVAATVEQQGTVDASGVEDGGQINITVASLYHSNADSMMTVASDIGKGGGIVVEGGNDANLTASGSYIGAGGTEGGRIDLLAGRHIVLLGALINTNGNTGGGQVHIGGDYLGQGNRRRATNTYLDEHTFITADGTDNGNGGRVIVWADNFMGFHGTISAKGGAHGGSGGFVETSGKNSIDAQGIVYTSAAHGTTGAWLIDPTNITISNAASTGTMTWNGTNFADTTASTSVLNVTTLTNQLENTNVIVTTASGLGGAGTITVSNAITWNSANSLTLLANSTITTNAAITNTGTGGLTLSAASHIAVNADITLTGGNLELRSRNAGGATTGYVYVHASIVTGGGDVTIGGGSDPITAGNGFAVWGGGHSDDIAAVMVRSINAGGGNIIINGQSSHTFVSRGVWLRGPYSNSVITTSGTGNISITGTGGSYAGIYNKDGYSTYDWNCDCSTDYVYHSSVTSTGSGTISINGGTNGNVNAFNLNLTYARIGYNGVTPFTGAIAINGSSANHMLLSWFGQDAMTIQTSNNNISITNPNIITVGALTTTNGAISVTSTGSYVSTGALTTSTTGNSAVNVSAASYISTGNITGSSAFLRSRSADAATGVVYTGNITTGGGDITIGGGSGTISHGSGYAIGQPGAGEGVIVYEVNANGGNIVINGRSGGINSNIAGVWLRGNNVATSGTGTISIAGISVNGGTHNPGIRNDWSGLAGYDEWNDPIYIDYKASITSTGSGDINILGVSGAGAFGYGMQVQNATVGGNSYSGNITMRVNSLQFTGSSTVRTTGNINILNSTPANGISVGTSVGGTLNISTAHLGYFNWGTNGYLAFGDANSGTVTVNTTHAFSKQVRFITGASADVVLAGNISSSAAGDAIVFASGRNFVNSSNRTITLTNAGAKRWIIYSTRDTDDTAGGLSEDQTINGQTYATLAPADITTPTYNGTQNTWVYSTVAGTITITLLGQTIGYGTDANLTAIEDTTFSFTCSDSCASSVLSSAPTLSIVSPTYSAASKVIAGSYGITASGAVASNGYTISYVNGTLTVNAASINVTADAKSKEFGASDPALTYSYTGLVDGDDPVSFTGALTRTTGENVAAGPFAILQGTLAATGNYTIGSYTGANLTVTARDITLTADNKSREYGLSNPALTYSCSALVGADSCTSIFSVAPTLATLADASSSVAGGPYAINISGGTTNGNYNVTGYTGGLLTITPATVTVTAANKSRYYGSNNPALTYTVSGLRNSDTEGSILSGISTTTAATASSNVNDYTITQAATLNSNNYNLTLVNGTLTVNPALLTVTPSAKSRTYGSANPSFDGSITGFVLGDLEGDIVTSAPTYSTLADLNSDAGDYNITSSGGTLSSSNYAFSYGTGTLTVNKATLTVTADNKSKTYASANPAFTGVITGFVLGQDENEIDSMPSYSTAATQYSNIGTYAITPASASDNNYQFTYVNGTLTIDAAALTITADAKSKIYGAADPSLTYVITAGSLENGDTLSGALTRVAGENVGTYSITQGTLTNSNYTIAYLPANFTITPATLTVTPNNLSRIYGAADPTLTYSYSGLVNSDTASVFSGALDRAAGENVGNYLVNIGSLSAGGNYSISLTGGRNLSIIPAALTITAADKSRGYGSANPALTATYSGLVNSDTSAVVSGLTLATVADANSNAGTYAITAAGGTASNYTITHANGVLTVTPGTLTISPDSFTITYGDAAPTYTGSITGALLGDSFTGSYSPASYAGNAGTYTINGSISGANIGNYTLVYNTGTLTVDKAILTVSATNASRAYGVANSFATSYTGFKYSDNASVVSGAASFATAAAQGSDIGTYAITPSLGTLTATNYDFAGFAPATLTITKANVIVATNNLSRTYGDTNPALTGSLTGLYAPDNITATYSTAATQQSNVGSYAISATLNDPSSRLGNYDVTYSFGNLDVTPAALSAVADNKTKAMGTTNPAFTLTLVGLKPWDTESVFSGYAFSTLAEQMSPQGSYAINLSGGTASNYTVTRYAGVLTIGAPVLPTSVITPTITPPAPVPAVTPPTTTTSPVSPTTTATTPSSNPTSSSTPTTSPASSNPRGSSGDNANTGNNNPTTRQGTATQDPNNDHANDNAPANQAETSGSNSSGTSSDGFSLESDCSVDNNKESTKCRKSLTIRGNARVQDI